MQLRRSQLPFFFGVRQLPQKRSFPGLEPGVLLFLDAQRGLGAAQLRLGSAELLEAAGRGLGHRVLELFHAGRHGGGHLPRALDILVAAAAFDL